MKVFLRDYLFYLCDYIFSLINFIVNDREEVQAYSAIHSINTKNKFHLRRPVANLLCFHKSIYFADIKILNNMPCRPKSLRNEIARFNAELRRYVNALSFFSVDEFLMFKNDRYSYDHPLLNHLV